MLRGYISFKVELTLAIVVDYSKGIFRTKGVSSVLSWCFLQHWKAVNMARDLRQLKGKNSYPDRCYYYSSTAIQGNKLVKDAQPLGRFDKRDTISFQWERPTINGMVSSVAQFVGTVETLDHVEDLKAGYVCY